MVAFIPSSGKYLNLRNPATSCQPQTYHISTSKHPWLVGVLIFTPLSKAFLKLEFPLKSEPDAALFKSGGIADSAQRVPTIQGPLLKRLLEAVGNTWVANPQDVNQSTRSLV